MGLRDIWLFCNSRPIVKYNHMQEKFIYYKSFFEEETFIEFKQFLKKNKIEFESKVENHQYLPYLGQCNYF